MTIDFTYYPVSNRVPGVYVEIDPSQANTATTLQNSLLIGQRLPTGNAKPEEPLLVSSKAQLLTAVGQGSMLAAMGSRYLDTDAFGPLYILPLDDNPSGVLSSGKIAVTGTAAADGTLNIYIAGMRVQVAVANNDTAAAIAGNVHDAINANPGLPVTATLQTTDVTVNSRQKGTVFDDIQLSQDYLGAAGGEYPVSGVTLAFTAMAGGNANPLINAALANLAATSFDFIGMPYTDTGNLNAMENFFADDTGRWSWEEMLYGHGFGAYRGTLGECVAFGQARNDQHMSLMAFNGSPDPKWLWTAEVVARCAMSLRVDPGLPLQYIRTTLQAPPIADRWTLGERNTLLYDGMSSTRVGDDGSVVIERMVTTYQKNTAGAVDNSYLDVETMYGLTFVARDLADYLATRYARRKLVSNATPVLFGSNTVNTNMIRASVITEYRSLEAQGYVQNSTIFAQSVIVENAGNGLVKILAPVDLVNQLRVIAIRLQFKKS